MNGLKYKIRKRGGWWLCDLLLDNKYIDFHRFTSWEDAIVFATE